jgi:hypothetical protein
MKVNNVLQNDKFILHFVKYIIHIHKAVLVKMVLMGYI